MNEPAPSKAPPAGTTVLLVTGATGAGKSTLIASLLAQRPHAEHWHVLVNDQGIVDPIAHANAGFVTVSRVGACACCIGAVTMRASLVRLLRRRPACVLIEASSQAHPAAIRAVLSEPGIAPAVKAVTAVCVLNGTMSTGNENALALVSEQAAHADHIVVTRAAAAADLTPAVAMLIDARKSRTTVSYTQEGRMDLRLLRPTPPKLDK